MGLASSKKDAGCLLLFGKTCSHKTSVISQIFSGSTLAKVSGFSDRKRPNDIWFSSDASIRKNPIFSALHGITAHPGHAAAFDCVSALSPPVLAA